MSALDVAQKAMNIAADMCVFTNRNFIIHSLENARYKPPASTPTASGASSPAATPAAPASADKK